jgi:hypothetical protein
MYSPKLTERIFYKLLRDSTFLHFTLLFIKYVKQLTSYKRDSKHTPKCKLFKNTLEDQLIMASVNLNIKSTSQKGTNEVKA